MDLNTLCTFFRRDTLSVRVPEEIADIQNNLRRVLNKDVGRVMKITKICRTSSARLPLHFLVLKGSQNPEMEKTVEKRATSQELRPLVESRLRQPEKE